MKKVSLKKEITSILDNAILKNGLCITEVTNEQGFKCVQISKKYAGSIIETCQ